MNLNTRSLSINRTRIIQWSKLVGVTGFTQAIVQFVGLICGVLVIRLLPTHEYALYTLANTMLGTMIVLADGGIATATMSEGGKVWQDRKKLGAVIVTGLNLRRTFALISLPISLSILLYLLRHHGASWILSILIVVSIIPAFFVMLQGGILEISPRLRQDIVKLQKIRVISSLGRLAILGLTIFTFPFAVVALSAASVPQIWANARFRSISSHYSDLKQKVDSAVKARILRMVWRLLPEAVYYCISGQIAIWLISVFGSTDSVAQIGALSRLGIVLSFFSILFANLVAPRFARLPPNPKILLSRYWQIHAGLILLCVSIVWFVWLFSTQILWVLGPNYFGLDTELVLMTISSCLGFFYGASFWLGTYRSWVIKPIIFISISVVTTIIAILMIDTSTLRNIIILNIIVTLIEVITLTVFNILKMRNIAPILSGDEETS
ncbi:MAG: polysaccharide biosynthesis protein [Ginsengibacter sp.]